MMHKLKLVFVFCALVVVIGLSRAYKYYNDNKLYGHFILKQWYAGLNSTVEDGYTGELSYDWGDTSQVFISGENNESTWLKLHDINGKVVDSLNVKITPQEKEQNSSELGYGYEKTFEYKIPKLKGGVYFWEKKVPFLIKGDASNIGVLYPTNTLNAYNISGGKSLYDMFSKQTHQVSFSRPMFPYVSFQTFHGLKFFFNHSKLNFTYFSDLDLDSFDVLEELDVLIIIGHSEYWTRQARLNFDTFIKKGGNAIVLSGNTMWWQVRYNEEKNAMICYKSLMDSYEDPSLRTINWSDTSLQYPISSSIILDFDHGGYGRKNGIGFNGIKVLDRENPVFENTSIGQLAVLKIPTKEYDGVDLNFSNGRPYIVNNSGFESIQLLGYDSLANNRNGAFVVGKKSKNSGLIYNVGTMDWCSAYGMGGEDSVLLKTITDNMIRICLNDSALINLSD